MRNLIVVVIVFVFNGTVSAGPADDKACIEVNQWLYQQKITPTDMSLTCNTSIRTEKEWYCLKDKIENEKDNFYMATDKCFK